MPRIQNPLNTLTPGEQVKLLLHGSKTYGNDPYELDVTFQGYTGEGADRRAIFDEVELYKYANRWCYGTSAERASIIQ